MFWKETDVICSKHSHAEKLPEQRPLYKNMSKYIKSFYLSLLLDINPSSFVKRDTAVTISWFIVLLQAEGDNSELNELFNK